MAFLLGDFDVLIVRLIATFTRFVNALCSANPTNLTRNTKKASLYAQELPHDERESMIKQAELNHNIQKEWFKSILKVKDDYIVVY